MADRTTVKPQQYLLNHDRQILSGKPRFGRRNGPGARMLRVHLRRACKSQFQFPDIGMRTSDRVKIWPGLIDRLAALVHPKVQGDAMERARHILFVSLRLGLVLAAFVSVPIYFTLHGKPGPLDAIAFAWVAAPLLAVWAAMRTGNLKFAHAVSALGFVGLAATLSLGSPSIPAAASMWLVLAPLDTLMTFSIPMTIAAGAASLIVLAAIVLVKAAGLVGSGFNLADLTTALFALLAIAYACASVAGAIHLADVRRRGLTLGSARYRSLVETIGELVLGIDRAGNVNYAGEAGEQRIGRSARELRGRGLFERIHVADRPAFLKLAADAADSGSTVTADIRIRISTDQVTVAGDINAPVFHWFELRARRVRLEDGDGLNRANVQVIAALRDINAARQHATDLEAARFEAEKANRWKDRFLANVSHELRTPLNAIIGFSEILGNSELMPTDQAKQIEYARIIHESGHHLLAVVNSILDISKIEAGSFDILPEHFEVQPIVDQCCDMLSLKAKANGIELVRNYAPQLDELVADKRAFKQVIINLLSNAVKFTPSNGTVTVNVRAEGNSMIFEVSDTGIGIRPPDLARLGDPFFQARATYDRPYEGTGLGLSVVRGLVGLHGGNIILESAPDVGTRVTVRLPMDCRAVAKESRTSAKIEAMPLKPKTGGDLFSNQPDMVKKIA